jgi:hypothetical protein
VERYVSPEQAESMRIVRVADEKIAGLTGASGKCTEEHVERFAAFVQSMVATDAATPPNDDGPSQ